MSQMTYIRFIITNYLLKKKVTFARVKKLAFGIKNKFPMLDLNHNKLFLGLLV